MTVLGRFPSCVKVQFPKRKSREQFEDKPWLKCCQTLQKFAFFANLKPL